MSRLMSTRSVVTSLPSTTTPGRDEHRAAPFGHVLVGVIADVGIVERAPAAQQDAPLADFFIAGQRLVEEVEQVVVQRHHLLHELDVLHQPHQVIGEKLDGGHGADAAGIKRGGMDVPAFHQAEHFARQRLICKRFQIKRPGERIQRAHDVGDGAEAVHVRRGARPSSRLWPARRDWSP